MSGCATTPDDPTQPVLRLRLVGRGDDAMRMEKRLRCAGRALGARVVIEWEARQHGGPVVYYGDEVVADRLLRTEALETLLRPLLKHAGITPDCH